jgi:hypothetical protein
MSLDVSVKRQEDLGLPDRWIKRFPKGRSFGIPADEYFWTPDGFFTAVSRMTPKLLAEIRDRTGGSFYDLTLKQQCELLNIRCETLDLTNVAYTKQIPKNLGRRNGLAIEEFVFYWYLDQGWDGDFCEGATFILIDFIIKNAFESEGLSYYPIYRKRNDKYIDCKPIRPKDLALIKYTLNTLSSNEIKNYSENSFVPLPKLGKYSLEMAIAGWKHIRKSHRGVMAKICERAMLGYFEGRGWPDITLFRGNDLKLVEIKKGNDKFTHRQAYWIRNYALPLNLDFQVMHVPNRG